MLSVAVHKDIAEYQPKVVGKMTGRTLASIAGALGCSVLTGLYIYFVLGWNVGDNMMLIYAVSLPFWCCGFIRPKGTDKSDVNQQVTVIEPEIGTTAVDGADGDKNVATDDKATVTDRVAYKNLIPGKEYTVKGTLHIKKTDDEGKVTEEILKVDGKPVMAETTFTPESAEGTVDVTFTFDSLSLKDKTHLVAFESLEHDGHELASHADIEDEGQTVTVRNPRISTTALDGIDKDKNVVTDDETVIIDTVA